MPALDRSNKITLSKITLPKKGVTMVYQTIGLFVHLAETTFGKELWKFLNENATIKNMEKATGDNKPAVEYIAKELSLRFNKDFVLLNKVDLDKAKQMIGHMTRQVMEGRGYRLKKSGVQITTTDFFTQGTTYSKA